MSRFFRLFTVLAFAVLSSACTARYIRQAQDHFSRAASAENASLMADYSAGAELNSSDPAHDYRISLALLDRELAQNTAELKQDRLYGTALVLKAMCHWRLAGLDGEDPHVAFLQQSLARIATAEQEGATVGPRDRALVASLPALRDHDRGVGAASFDQAGSFFASSLAGLQSVLDDEMLVPERHPVRVYLMLSQLSTCRAWHASAYAFHGTNRERLAAAAPAKEEARKVLAALNSEFPRDSGVEQAARHFAAATGLGDIDWQ